MTKRWLTGFLAVVMVFSLFTGVAPINASAADGFTYSQTQVCTDDAYTNVATFSDLTRNAIPALLVPGLSDTEQLVPQGITYWAAKNWMLVSAYSSAGKNSVIMAIDMEQGKYVGEYILVNADGSACTSHMGGIAVGNYNLYYTAGSSKIGYIPLSSLTESALPVTVTLQAEAETANLTVLNGANASYCNISDGILWAGNFYHTATGYNTPASANYNSMLYGYQLSGNDSAAEWSSFKSIVNQPTYSVAIPNAYTKVQGVAVGGGYLYLSQSYGRKNNSTLSIFELDLNNSSITLDSAKTTMTNLPMSEGVTMVGNYLYCLYESGAYTYRAEDPLNICTYPTDQIWQLDPYSLMNVERPADVTENVWYEKVTTLEEATQAGEEYVIAYETADGTIYAIDASGLPGATATTGTGTQANINDNLSLKGTALNYVRDGDRLFVTNTTSSMRWGITGSATNSNYVQPVYIKSMDSTYAQSPYLYVGSRLIYMSFDDNNTKFANIRFAEAGDGEHFQIYYSGTGAYQLWCNDGTYNNAYNTFYNSDSRHTGQVEASGTFHGDALFERGDDKTGDANTGNRTGGAVDVKYSYLTVYKRMDSSTSVTEIGKSGTNLAKTAALQADGTYSIDLSAYTTGTTTYSDSEMEKLEYTPTDFVLVLDLSGSMTKTDASGYVRESATAWSVSDAAGKYFKDKNGDFYQVKTGKTSEVTYVQCTIAPSDFAGATGDSTGGAYVAKDYYYKVGNAYYQIYFRRNGVLAKRELYYYNGSSYIQIVTGSDKITAYQRENGSYLYYVNKDNEQIQIGSNVATTSATAYNGYLYTLQTGMTRLEAMQNAVKNFIDQISTAKVKYGADYRIAIATFASDDTTYNNDKQWENTGLYNGTTRTLYSSLTATNYKNALQDATSSNLATIVNGLSATGATATDSGLKMAYKVLQATGRDYTSDDYNACVVLFTDGAPGDGNNESSAITYANSALTQAKSIKSGGALLYTIGFGTSNIGNFNATNFLRYTSSEYPNATSMTVPGTKNSDGKTYAYALATNAGNALNDAFSSISKSYTEQDASSLTTVNLDAASPMKDFVVTDQFDCSEASVTVSFEEGTTSNGLVYVFDNPLTEAAFEKEKGATITTAFDKTTGTVTVTGFDYSKYYVAEAHNGYKLCVRIEGLKLKNGVSGSDIATNTDQSGIYDNSGALVNAFPVPTVDVPEYTYVLDFGLPAVSPDMTGALAVAGTPAKQDTTAYSTSLTSDAFACTVAGGCLTFQPETNWSAENTVYSLTQKGSAYEWAKITVIPASNVLYEETALTLGTSAAGSWEAVGTEDGDVQQCNNTTLYGYDPAYAGEKSYSNGSAIKASVTNSNFIGPDATFTFTGTGFDVMSVCGPTTGILAVNVKDSGGNNVKTYLVDTYYSGDPTLVTEPTTLYQVPVVQNLALPYGTYKVTMNAFFLNTAGAVKSAEAEPMSVKSIAEQAVEQLGLKGVNPADVELIYFDENSILNENISTATTFAYADASAQSVDVYVDSVRIYNPLGKNDSPYIETEKNVEYVNIINALKDESIVGSVGVAYVEGTAEKEFEAATYQNEGPQNELYLANITTSEKEQALVFRVEGTGSLQISAKAVYGSPTLVLNGKEISGFASADSATEMYYDIPVTGGQTYTIRNMGGNSILSLVNLKLVGDIKLVADTEAITLACQMLSTGDFSNDPVDPVEPIDPIDPDDSKFDNPFIDVFETSWFYKAVKYVFEHGLFAGMTPTTFEPQTPMTRGMFVTVLGRMANASVDNNMKTQFADVPIGRYYTGYVGWAGENGIIYGFTATSFQPNTLVSREQMVLIMYNYAQFAGIDVSNVDRTAMNTFPDAEKVSGWATDAMAWAVNVGLISGSDGYLNPKGNATRAETAQILISYSNLLTQ